MNNWTLLFLNENYRSGSAICTAANRLIAHNVKRLPKQLVSATGTEGGVLVDHHDTGAEEAAGISASIKARIKSGDAPDEIAVLLRTNRLVSEYRKVLQDSGVPVRSKAADDSPADWPVARAFIAMLTNPENDGVTYRFLKAKLGQEKADQMQRNATADFTTLNSMFLHIRNVALSDVTTAMMQAQLGRESIGRVRDAVATLQPEATILELQYALAQKDAVAREEGHGVTVCTLHSAKGREMDFVYLPAWEEKILPFGENIDEERRLAYVGITRARRQVVITSADNRNKEWTGMTVMQASRFVQETLDTSRPAA